MKIARTLEEFREFRKGLAGTVSFVPTLGALHHGHTALLERGRTEADDLVVSIFLNPMQFGPNEDLDTYPADFDQDVEICKRNGVSILFAPTRESIFPEPPHTGLHTQVAVDRYDGLLCDASRPGHFQGVATIVAKLFNIVQPDIAFFGEKDYQQLAIVKQLVKDLSYPIEIRSIPVVRESDGLAVSSRNQRLRPEERAIAPKIWEGLSAARRAYRVKGCHEPRELEAICERILDLEKVFRIDYIRCIDARSLQTLEGTIHPGEAVVIAAAAWLGDVRLIDNLPL